MTGVSLAIRYGTKPLRKTRAWYFAGEDAAGWVREIAGWEVAHCGVRLYPVPRSREDLRPRGVLITLPDAPRAEVTGRCVRYGRVAGRLFLPVEARFEPEVDEAELEALLSDGYTYVWHPVVGLVAFEPSETLGLADLLCLGPASNRPWDAAIPGVAFSRRLTSLNAAEPPSVETILGEGQEDIGTEADSTSELPPSPEEPKTGLLSSAGRQGRRAIAGVVRWLARRLSPGRGRPGWTRRLEQWAEKSLAKVHAALSASRHRAVLRLLHLLERDPDRGLRFALPLRDPAHRGLAPPSDRFAKRKVDFDLRDLGGGGPGDVWCISADYHFRLMARYRELANREIRLGRYRRAAYILANLLGDLDAAASALVQGRHWREAAVLYRDRLHRPHDAARCLEEGGLWTEAISLYEELQEYEKAGELLLKLEQPDRACEMFHKSVAKHRGEGDALSAARVLDQRLNEPDQALAELENGWPYSSQAGQCLREVFRLFERLGRHETARDRVERLRTAPIPQHAELPLVDVLRETATGYPDRNVRETAADSTRAVVSRRLPSAPTSIARQLLAAVRSLVPEDKLLGRDCDRYLYQQEAPVRHPPVSLREPAGRLAPIRTIRLRREVVWKEMIWSRRTIYAAGFLDDHLVLARANWNGVVDPLNKFWKLERHWAVSRVLLAADPAHDDLLLVHVVGSRAPLPDRVFPATDRFPDRARAGGLQRAARGVVGAAQAQLGVTWLLVSENWRLTLMARGPGGELIATHAVPFPQRQPVPEQAFLVMPVPLLARGDLVYLGLGDTLLVYHRAGQTEVLKFPHPIVSLAASAPNTRTRIAVALTQGGTVWWDDFEGRRTEGFAHGMHRPVIGFNRGGYLIAASADGGEVYATDSRRLRLKAELPAPRAKPIAVLPGPRTDQFAVATAEGEIAVYEVYSQTTMPRTGARPPTASEPGEDSSWTSGYEY